MKRREFLKHIAAAAAPLPCISSTYARAENQNTDSSDRTFCPDEVAEKLRLPITNLLESLEEKTRLKVEFRRLKSNFGVVAQYSFEQPDRPVVHLRKDWEDVDVAHELMHMQLELVDAYTVLAWRKNVPRESVPEAAFGLIRSYTDDMLVFDRLARMGLKIDGEVIKRQFFDDICTKVPRYLRAGRPPKYDGMAHLDNVAEGKYADLRRSSFLVQAELFQKNYGNKLSDEHKYLLADFIETFRKHRPKQAERADKVLQLFDQCNIEETRCHAEILTGWAALEQLDKIVGVSRYVRKGSGFLLPFPSDHKTLEQNSKNRT
ncbi:MAG: hypothetical protein ACYS8Z_03780 [Planctomycetota bacterium]|jgi:hypothetical protein